MLKQLLSYDNKTGIFLWRVDRANRAAGSIAGNIGPNGYRTICVNYRSYYAHHLAILFSTGRMPPKGLHVDHIDGDKANNRISNLRVVPPSVNGVNRKFLNKNNKSGATGVWQAPNNKFIAYIGVNKRRRRLGVFSTFDEAKAARENAHAHFSQS